jgi:VWFA-related protein
MTRQPVRRPALTSARIAVATAAAFAALAIAPAGLEGRGQKQDPQSEGFRFRSAVDLVNVTATVTDRSGRFVSGLRAEDFEVYEDGEPQEVSLFSSERVPVSLGIALDTSGSMEGEKIRSARAALDRFLFDLLGDEDELFLYRFNDRPDLVEEWTADRHRLSRALAGLVPRGGTALYDTVAEAVPLAQSGQNRKKALLIISDGNDTNSMTSVHTLKQLVRESEVLIYAIGIDGRGGTSWTRGRGGSLPPRAPFPIPFPVPGRRPPWPGSPPTQPGGGGRGGMIYSSGDRANIGALRELTDDSGGRTEVVRDASDLDPATANIADELSQQYYLGYSSNRPRDGRWHTIDVRVRDEQYRVRARRGYMATR